MLNKQIILFDMDGTTNDSLTGIINGMNHTLLYHGQPARTKEELIKYVGPSFRETLIDAFGFAENEAYAVHGVMIEYMMSKGMFENKVYDGIEELLKTLKSQGKTIALATAKMLEQARAILRHFNMDKYFDFVGGVDNKIFGKSAVIRHVLESLNVKDKSAVIMIGDRSNDILGAAENGIESIGVLYGYGTLDELAACNPTYIVNTVEELKTLLC